MHVAALQLKTAANIANIANKLARAVCPVFFVGNVGYLFLIANIANKPTATWPRRRLARAGWHGRVLASACVGIANIANDRLRPGQVSDH